MAYPATYPQSLIILLILFSSKYLDIYPYFGSPLGLIVTKFKGSLPYVNVVTGKCYYTVRISKLLCILMKLVVIQDVPDA